MLIEAPSSRASWGESADAPQPTLLWKDVGEIWGQLCVHRVGEAEAGPDGAELSPGRTLWVNSAEICTNCLYRAPSVLWGQQRLGRARHVLNGPRVE